MLRYQTPIGRLTRLVTMLEHAYKQACGLHRITQETNNLNLQSEAAWMVYQLGQIIEHGNQVLARVKPTKKLYPRENRS